MVPKEIAKLSKEERLALGEDPRGFTQKHEITKPGSHVATQRGYAAGVVIEPGEPVPADIPVAEEWMDEAPKPEKAEKAKAE
jgi:hypothetical protein